MHMGKFRWGDFITLLYLVTRSLSYKGTKVDCAWLTNLFTTCYKNLIFQGILQSLSYASLRWECCFFAFQASPILKKATIFCGKYHEHKARSRCFWRCVHHRIWNRGKCENRGCQENVTCSWPRQKETFFKEVALRNTLLHPNIVTAWSQPLAIMLEYVYFDFKLFGANNLRVSSRSGKHCVFVHNIRRGSQCIVGRFQIVFSFGRIPFLWVPAEWKKCNYMTYLLGFNIVACTWRLFLHVKVNIMHVCTFLCLRELSWKMELWLEDNTVS